MTVFALFLYRLIQRITYAKLETETLKQNSLVNPKGVFDPCSETTKPWVSWPLEESERKHPQLSFRFPVSRCVLSVIHNPIDLLLTLSVIIK